MPLRLGTGQWLHEIGQSVGPCGLGELTCQYRAESMSVSIPRAGVSLITNSHRSASNHTPSTASGTTPSIQPPHMTTRSDNSAADAKCAECPCNVTMPPTLIKSLNICQPGSEKEATLRLTSTHRTSSNTRYKTLFVLKISTKGQ